VSLHYKYFPYIFTGLIVIVSQVKVALGIRRGADTCRWYAFTGRGWTDAFTRNAICHTVIFILRDLKHHMMKHANTIIYNTSILIYMECRRSKDEAGISWNIDLDKIEGFQVIICAAIDERHTIGYEL